MSKLIEQIKRISSSIEAPIGFKKPLSDTLPPAILLIQDLSKYIETKNSDGMNIEADAAVINAAELNPVILSKFVQRKINVPIGIHVGEDNKQDVNSLITADTDFIIFNLASQVSGLEREGLGRILKINKTLSQGMIKAINDLGINVDCIMLENFKSEIDFELLLRSHSFADILNKPLIINITNKLTVTELVELSNANVRALILSTNMLSESIRQLRTDIASLPKVNKKKVTKSPLIPRMSTIPVPEEAEEDGEEDGLSLGRS